MGEETCADTRCPAMLCIECREGEREKARARERERDFIRNQCPQRGVLGAARRQALHHPIWEGLTPGPNEGSAGNPAEFEVRQARQNHANCLLCCVVVGRGERPQILRTNLPRLAA